MLEQKLYLLGCYPNSTTPRIWTYDGTTFAEWVNIDTEVDGYCTFLLGGHYFSVDKNLYICGRYHGGVYTEDGFIYRWDGSSWIQSTLITGGTLRWCKSLCEFKGYMYALVYYDDFFKVYKQDPTDTWTEVFYSNPYGHFGGGVDPTKIMVVTDGVTEYMVAWQHKDTGADPDFFITKDGAVWYNSNSFIGSYCKVSYLFWDDANAYWRSGTLRSTVDRSSPSLENGSLVWTIRDAHLHPNGAYNNLHCAFGAQFKLPNNDVLLAPAIPSAVAPYANEIRRFISSTSLWANEQTVAAGVDFTAWNDSRNPSVGLVAWGGKAWFLLPMNSSSRVELWSYNIASGLWTEEVAVFSAMTNVTTTTIVVGEQLDSGDKVVMRVEDRFVFPFHDNMLIGGVQS